MVSTHLQGKGKLQVPFPYLAKGEFVRLKHEVLPRVAHVREFAAY